MEDILNVIVKDVAVGQISGDDDREVTCDVEGNMLTLRFPTAEEAARFRTKILVGGLLVGSLVSPTAALGANSAADGSGGSSNAPITAIHSSTGEDNAMGSAVIWINRQNESR